MEIPWQALSRQRADASSALAHSVNKSKRFEFAVVVVMIGQSQLFDPPIPSLGVFMGEEVDVMGTGTGVGGAPDWFLILGGRNIIVLGVVESVTVSPQKLN